MFIFLIKKGKYIYTLRLKAVSCRFTLFTERWIASAGIILWIAVQHAHPLTYPVAPLGWILL